MLPTAVGLCLVLLVHVFGVEAATPLWPNCSVLSSYHLPSGGGDFEAVGCVFPATTTYVGVGIDAGATASVVIRDGSVLAGQAARIGVDSSNMLGPVQVTITGMVFGRDASFLFTGNLSPLSSLLVANNTFNLTQLNYNSFQLPGTPSGDSIIVAIRLGSIHQDMKVADGASIAVLNNSVTGSLLPSTCTLVAVCFVGQSGSIRNNSTLLLGGNSIVNSTVPSANVALVYLYLRNPNGGGSTNTLTISNQSRMAITDNYMMNCTLSNVGYVARLCMFSSVSSSASYTTVSNITKLSLGGQSALAISGNSMAGCTVSKFGSIYVAYMYLYSSYSNTNTGSDTNIGVYLSTAVSVEGQSTIAMDGNSLWGSTAGSAQAAYLQVFCQATTTATWSNSYTNVTLDLRGRSAVSLSGNTIGNCQVGTAEVVCLSYESSAGGSGTSGVGSRVLLLLGNQSTVAMSNNSIWGSTATYQLYVARAYISSNTYSGDDISRGSATTMTVSGQSAISISGNAMRNCTTPIALVAYLLANAFGGPNSPDTTLTLDSQSRVLVDGNSLGTSLVSDGGLTSSVAYVSIYGVTYDGLTILALSNRSAFSMSGNTAFKSNLTVIYAAFLQIRSDGTSNGTLEIALSDLSWIDLSRNAIWGSTILKATVAYFSLSTRLRAQVTLGGQSAIAINDNSLSNSSVRLNAVVAHFFTTPRVFTNTDLVSTIISLSLSGQCEFTLSRNAMDNCSATNAYVAFLSPYSGYGPYSHCDIAINESSVALSGNSLKGSAISSVAIVSQVSPYSIENMNYSSTDVALNNQSTLHLSGNGIGNCTVPVAYVALVGLNRGGGLSNLNVDGSSIVSVEGNRLAVGPAQATLSALLTIGANTSITGGSRLLVVGNEVIGYGLLVSVSLSVSVQATSALQVIGNCVDSMYGVLAELADLSLSGSLLAEGNTISSTFDGYLLVNASRFVNGPSATVSACGNLRSWDGAALSAASHMNPSALGALAADCPRYPTPATTTPSTTVRPTTTTERPTTSKVTPATITTSTIEQTTSIHFNTTSTLPAVFYVTVTSTLNASTMSIDSGARHYYGSLIGCLPNGAGALTCQLSFNLKLDAELYIRDVSDGRVSGAAAAASAFPSPSTVAPKDDDNKTGLIVGVVVGVVILAAIICIAVYLLSSRKSRSGGAATDNYSPMDAAFVHNDEAKVNLISTEML